MKSSSVMLACMTILAFALTGCGSQVKVPAVTADAAGSPGTAIKEIKLPAKWDELMQKAGYRPLQEFFLK